MLLGRVVPEDLVIRLEDEELHFEEVPLVFQDETFQNLFGQKNNKTLGETLRHRRYARLKHIVEEKYKDAVDQPLGRFLYGLKLEGDPFYQEFLNPYGDLEYGRFHIRTSGRIDEKGLYIYVEDGRVMYVGRCRDSFKKRINQGYGRIHPKNCYLDGQSTNCRINHLVSVARRSIGLYLLPLTDDHYIESAERALIASLGPPWNREQVQDLLQFQA